MSSLQVLLAYLLAASVASERLVTIVKTFLPTLAEEKKKPTQEVDPVADRWRRVSVLGTAILSAWITVGLSAPGNAENISFGNFLPFATVEIGALSLPLVLVAVLVSGGSALWNNLLGYTKAVKDTKQVKQASETQELHRRSKRNHVTASAAGTT
jgi:hypothetical protein